MQPLIPALALIAVLLVLGVAAIVLAHRRSGAVIVYGFGAAAAALLAAIGLRALLDPIEAQIVPPLGVPWIRANFRLDALSAFFLTVVNAGAAAASVYAIGYGRHEHAPGRVLPFFPAFLAGMSLVILADDAFTFLLSWE